MGTIFKIGRLGLFAGVATCALLWAASRLTVHNSLALSAFAQNKDTPDMTSTVHAPDFPKDFAWLNTDKPLSFADELKGQVVLLDFWTYCCINCMHVLPDLAYLEDKYKDQPVAIIGVHSAKYDNEGDAANIRAAIQRYEVHHPVIVDLQHKVWDDFGVHAWPTLILVGADGRIIGQTSGEGKREILDKSIEKALAEGKAKGTLAKEPLKLAKEGQVRAASSLSFPGKVIADPANKRLIIIDSNHNRIVQTSYPGDDGHVTVQQVIGSGKTGATDGDFATASFNRPQGGTLAGATTLWIADTENHLIRRVDLDKKTVTTALGTGKQVFDPEAGKSGRQQGLNSPWDVAVAGNRLYISQAGQHQIFAMNLMTGMTEVAAGTAREDILDGPGDRANLAQPSGLAIDTKNQILYFADSEVSAVRGLNLKDQKVSTVIGHGLFDFGDVDGNFSTARLQHALGVTLSADGSKLYVADTYNHKIRLVDPEKRTATTLAGTGKSGTGASDGTGGPVQFFEPASLSVGGPHELFVSDTNNHRIVRLDPDSGAWKELVIEGLSPPGMAEVVVDPDASTLGSLSLAEDKPITLKLSLKLPRGNHFTPAAPISLAVTDGMKTLYSTSLSAPTTPVSALVPLPATLNAMVPADALTSHPRLIYVMVYYTHCADGPSAVCTPAQASWTGNVSFSPVGPQELKLSH